MREKKKKKFLSNRRGKRKKEKKNCLHPWILLEWIRILLTLIAVTKLAVLLATSLADWTKCRLATGFEVLEEARRQALQRADVCLATAVAADNTWKRERKRSLRKSSWLGGGICKRDWIQLLLSVIQEKNSY